MAVQIGTLKRLFGVVVAIDAYGVERVLAVGDAVYEGENVIVRVGGSAVFELQGAQELVLSENSSFALDKAFATYLKDADPSKLSDAQLDVLRAEPDLNDTHNGVSLAQPSDSWFAKSGTISNVTAKDIKINAPNDDLAQTLNTLGRQTPQNIATASKPAEVELPSLIDVSRLPSEVMAYLYPKNGKLYLKMDSFDVQDGWYVSKDKLVIFGSESTKKLIITSNDTHSGSDASVIKLTTQVPNLFSTQVADDILLDAVKLNLVWTSDGNDKINLTNGAEVARVDGGAGDDELNLQSGSIITGNVIDKDGSNKISLSGGSFINGNIDIDSDKKQIISVTQASKVSGTIYAGSGESEIYLSDTGTIVSSISAEDGDDKITIQNGAKINGAVDMGAGDDELNLQSGSIITGNVIDKDGSNKISLSGGSFINGNIDIDSDKKQIISVTQGSKVTGNIYAGSGESEIYIGGENTKVREISGEGGDDKITITDKANAARIDGGDGGDNIAIKNGSMVSGAVDGGAGNDEIHVSGAIVGQSVFGGFGSNNITIDGGSKISGWVTGSFLSPDRAGYESTGDNTIIVKGAGTEVGNIGDLSKGNADIKVIEGAKVTENVFGDEGDDKILVDNSTVSGSIHGGWGRDKITVLNNAILGGNIHSDGDGDEVVINNVRMGGKIYTGESIISAGDTEGNIVRISESRVHEVYGGDKNDIFVLNDSNIGKINAQAGFDKLTEIASVTIGDKVGIEKIIEAKPDTADPKMLIIESISTPDKDIDLLQLSDGVNKFNSISLESVAGAILNINPKDVLDLGEGGVIEIKGGSDDKIKGTASDWSATNATVTHVEYSADITDTDGNTRSVIVKIQNDIQLEFA